jgi:hypothetical protein
VTTCTQFSQEKPFAPLAAPFLFRQVAKIWPKRKTLLISLKMVSGKKKRKKKVVLDIMYGNSV